MSNLFFNHEAAHLTARICTEFKGRASSGTAFFYMDEFPMEDNPPRHKLFLITNRHVIPHDDVKLTITLNKRKKDRSPDYGNTETITLDGLADKYYGHPVQNIDLTCVDVSEITRNNLDIRHIGHESLTPIDHERVGLGSEVLYIGYPANCYDRINNLPLTRKGSLASLPWINFDGKGQLVIDGHVYPGSSGSPVFIDYDQKYKLLGVLSHAFAYRESSEKTYFGLRALMKSFFMSPREPSEKTYLGLGIVIKQEHIRELIKYAHNEIIQKIKILDSNTTSEANTNF